jgi:hypothetical protein
MPKKCAFCTRPADSREHVFSEWMLDTIPRGERFVTNERNTRTGEYVRYGGRKVKVTAKVVCTPCNNGWMSDLENLVAKPAMGKLLMGQSTAVLDATALKSIAIFGFKTLLIANHKDLTAPPFFPSADRVRFRQNLLIPHGVQVWIASRKVIPGKYYGFWKSLKGGSEQPSRYGFSIYVCTWNFQSLVLQIFAWKWKDKRRRKTIPLDTIVQSEYWDDAAIPIWPLSGRELQWPPPAYLGDETFLAFRDRFDDWSIRIPQS